MTARPPVRLLSLLTSLWLAACVTGNEGARRTSSDAEPAQAAARQPVDPAEQAYREGLRYKNGDGVPRDDVRATAHFRRAAEAGHVEARFLVGLAHKVGAGAPRDDVAAGRWFRRAAEAGHLEAQFFLGLMHLNGVGMEKSAVRAAAWFERAAEQGHAGAQYRLGRARMRGHGTLRDEAEGLEWLAAAAGQNHVEAMHDLGLAHSRGLGTAKDRAWAARWYAKGARAGYAPAQFMMGVAWGGGLGLPRDEEQAFFWLESAARGGHAGAKKLRDAIAGKLTAAALERARRAADARKNETASGMATSDVPTLRFVQFALRRLGHDPGPIDGLMGPRTRKAIVTYKRDRGLAVNAGIDTRFLSRLRRDRLDRLSGKTS